MELECLEKRAIETLIEQENQNIKDAENKIKAYKNNISDLKEKLRNLYYNKFIEKYDCNPTIVYIDYIKRLRECSESGTFGYAWWVPLEPEWWLKQEAETIKKHGLETSYFTQGLSTFLPFGSHMLVMEYEKAQPTQKERDAYFAIHEKEMRVAKEPHREYWGN